MSDQDTRRTEPTAADAVVEVRRRPSIVWLIPVVALLAGGWVGYRAVTERGPEITISFREAEGLEAGKTTIRYKDVEVGVVETIVLAPDLSDVVCTARMAKGMSKHLTEETRFWVTKARVAGGRVSGLGTLLSGAYIGMEPGHGGKEQRSFQGLEVAPVVTADMPGRHFVLHSDRAGLAAVGTPVFYRKVEVGQVVASALDPSGEFVTVRIFVEKPYDARVHTDTRFWDASGIDVSLGADGLQVHTESVVSILIGGIAFESPAGAEAVPAAADTVFPLYENYEATRRPVYTRHIYWLLHFHESVRGLSPGTAVEFRGIPIGRVADVKLEFDPAANRFRIPVLVEIEPERIAKVDLTGDARRAALDRMVRAGMRAQLKTGSLLTGQLLIALDMHPNAPPAEIDWSGPYPELPTIPTPLEEITASLTQLAERLGKVPVDEIATELRATLALVNRDMMPRLGATIAQAERTLASADTMVSADSPVSQELRRALVELAQAARSVGLAAEQLQRQPQSLIFGKEKNE